MFATNLIQNAILDEKAKITLQNQIAVKKEAEDLKKEVSNLTTKISELQLPEPSNKHTVSAVTDTDFMAGALLIGTVLVAIIILFWSDR